MSNKINRLEVIDHTSTAKTFGRAFVKWDDRNFLVTLSLQDDGRTLKIFLRNKDKEVNNE